MSYTVEFPTAYFPKATVDQSNGGGFVYIGAVDTDPTVLANRITVTIIDSSGNAVDIAPSAQPFELNAGGQFSYQGSVVRLRVAVRYSMTIQDSNGANPEYFPQAVDELTDAVSLPEIADDPDAVSNVGQLYTKDVAGISELFYIDDAGTVLQLTTDGVVNSPVSSLDVTGVTMGFFMSAVPTGWTLNGDHDDAMMRVVSSAGGGSGGSDSPTTISVDLDHAHTTPNFTLTQAQLPAYNLQYTCDATLDTLGAGAGITSVSVTGTQATINIPSGGSGNAINIGSVNTTSGLEVALALKYTNWIIGVKD